MAGVTVSGVTPISLRTYELGETSATFTIVLTSEPIAPVTFAISTSVPTEATAYTPSIAFNAGDWSVPKTVSCCRPLLMLAGSLTNCAVGDNCWSGREDCGRGYGLQC